VIVDVEDFDRLARMGDDENDLLDGVSHRSTTSRLSCQITFGEDLAGLRIRIAPED
jgi:ferredoxin, 2Fe-2S